MHGITCTQNLKNKKAGIIEIEWQWLEGGEMRRVGQSYKKFCYKKFWTTSSEAPMDCMVTTVSNSVVYLKVAVSRS